MQQLVGNPTTRAKCTLIASVFALFSLITLVHNISPGIFTFRRLQIPRGKDRDTDGLETTEIINQDHPIIPNIVHFVLLIDPSQLTGFDVPFRHFVAIFSAYHYLRPDNIYIHTNAEQHLIDQAVVSNTNPYIQAISKIPNVIFYLQSLPNQTTSGQAIDELPHQSDFIRTKVLSELGGVYLDDDAYVLRDLAPLRISGFDNIVGKQLDDQICNAVIVSSAENELIKAYRTLQDEVFDGSWERHSTELLTALVMEFQTLGHQVLVLPQDSFFPSAWWQEDLQMIYGVHENEGPQPANDRNLRNLSDFIHNFELGGPKTWHRDWRSSYVLHGWTSGIERNMDEEARHELFGSFGGITPAYILARDSNFARAVFPVVQHAIDRGMLNDVSYDQA